MGGDGLDALPEQLPRGVRHGKIRVTLAVKQGMLADDLQPDRADDLSLAGLHHLEFRQPFFQFFRRQMHGSPQLSQAWKIVGRGAADAEIGRTHAGHQIGPARPKSQNPCENPPWCRLHLIKLVQPCARMESNVNYE